MLTVAPRLTPQFAADLSQLLLGRLPLTRQFLPATERQETALKGV